MGGWGTMIVAVRSSSRASRLRLVPLVAVAVLVGLSCGYSPEEKALIASRDEYRLQIIEVMESIEWPEGYEVVEVVEQSAVLFFEEPFGPGGTGFYGYRLEGPAGSTPVDWFTDIDAALIESGDFERWSVRASGDLPACDSIAAWRDYLHVETSELLSVRTARQIRSDTFTVDLSFDPSVRGSFNESMRQRRFDPVCS